MNRFALATFFFTLGGPNWISNENWLTGEHACSWYGVVCDRSEESFIYEIDIARNNATGVIPAEISLFGDLRSLVLTGNKLYGPVPAVRLGMLKSLSLLFLNKNGFTGSLTDLETLNANNNLSKCDSGSQVPLNCIFCHQVSAHP